MKKSRNIPNANNSENLLPVWPWEHDAIDEYRHYTGRDRRLKDMKKEPGKRPL